MYDLSFTISMHDLIPYVDEAREDDHYFNKKTLTGGSLKSQHVGVQGSRSPIWIVIRIEKNCARSSMMWVCVSLACRLVALNQRTIPKLVFAEFLYRNIFIPSL